MQQKLQLLRQLLNLLLLRKSEYIYQEALNHIGVDASPDDLVDDVVGCAESVSAILQKHINMPIITGTYTLFDYMNKSTNFARTDIPMPGNIIISPTGMGDGSMRGHVGIVGKNDVVMSNDSYSGKWMANYTIPAWRARYSGQGKMPVYFFKVIK